jgi:hypothetical protein
MDAQTVTNLPPAATHDGPVRCALAIELSKKSWIIGVNTPLSEKISKYTVEGWKELAELLDKIRTRVGRELKRPVEFVSCYEAGYDGFWIHRLLEKNGVRNFVVDPASVQVDRRARRLKTDNVDVTKLLRSLMAYLRGEPKVWSVVRVPTIAEEDDRRLLSRSTYFDGPGITIFEGGWTASGRGGARSGLPVPLPTRCRVWRNGRGSRRNRPNRGPDFGPRLGGEAASWHDDCRLARAFAVKPAHHKWCAPAGVGA